MNHWRHVLLGCSVIAGAGASFEAAAQQATNTRLEEVVVTAQRRSESLEDVPISITVASGEQLLNAGVTRLQDIALVAPAVQLSRIGVYTQPAIRGVTTVLAGNYENNVAIYVDGYYLPFTRGLNTELVNIDQVQVLKGPQGTLFGRNATGGAILIETLDPSMTERSGRVKATYKRFNDAQVQGYFSTPLTQSLAWNIAGSYRESDGYIENVSGFDTAPIENYNVTTKFRWEPTDALAISGKYETLSVSDGNALAVTYAGRSLVEFLNPGTYVEPRDHHTSVNFPIRNSARQHTAAATIEYDFGWGKLNSVTAYQREDDKLHYDLDGTQLQVFEQRTRDRNQVISEDLNLTSTGEGPLQYVVGLYYFDSKLETLDNASLNALSGPAVYVTGQINTSKTEAFATYADLTWEAMPRLFLTGGIRYSDETKDVNVVCPVLSPGCPSPVFFDDEESFDSWTPRAVARYELDDNSSVYASFSKGFKSGLINIASPFNKVDPEKIDAWEVGYKTARADWRLDAAAYYYDYTDLQVSSLQIVNGINTAITTNAATAEIYGAEMQFSAGLTDDLNVRAGVAYTHARYKDFPDASANAINVVGLNTTTCGGAPCTQDWGGKRLTRAPDWTGNVGADYTFQTGVGQFVLAGNVAFTSAYAPVRGDLDVNGAYRYVEDGYTMINMRAGWSPVDNDAFTLSVIGENLGDTRYYFYRTGNAFGDYHVLGQPRTLGVSAEYRF